MTERVSAETDRRTVLKTLGATSATAVGTLAVPTGSVTAAGEPLGKATLASVSLGYRGAPAVPRKWDDSMAGFVVDTDEGRIALTDVVTDRERQLLTGGRPVVQADDLRAVPATAFGGTTASLPVTTTSWLQTVDEHSLPTVETAYRGGEFVVSVEGQSDVRLGAGEATRVELDPRTVEVTRRADTTKEVPDPKTGGTMTVQESTTESVRLNPVVEATNLGELPVYGANA
ncbi:MAG: hypothetical protein ABEI75_04950 [Halobaculum sp.]